MGLTVSDVVRIALTKVAKEKALPFALHVPNEVTAQTLEKSQQGEEVTRHTTAKALFDDLGL